MEDFQVIYLFNFHHQSSIVRLLSQVWLCDPMNCSTIGFHYLPEFAQTPVHWVGDSIHHLILCHPFSSCPQSFPASRSFPVSWLFSSGGWSFGASAPSNEYSGFISFKIDWFDLLAVQGTFKSFLQNHSSKASVLQHSAFFMVQLSHPYMTTGKNMVLTIWTFALEIIRSNLGLPWWSAG